MNLTRVFRLRDRLVDDLAGLCGAEPTGPAFEALVAALAKRLPKETSESVIFQTARPLLGKMLTHQTLYYFAWLLAGNLDRLQQGEVILPWSQQPEPEPMPVQVLEYFKAKTRRGKPAARYRLRILAGRACPLVVEKTWPTGFVRFLARSTFGFSRKRVYQSPVELVRLRFIAVIDSQFCYDNQPGFDQVACTPGLLNWNRKIMLARSHQDPPCPRDFTHPCFRCPVGYDLCGAGVHPRTYIFQVCPMCHRESYRDPSTSLCLECSDAPG